MGVCTLGLPGNRHTYPAAASAPEAESTRVCVLSQAAASPPRGVGVAAPRVQVRQLEESWPRASCGPQLSCGGTVPTASRLQGRVLVRKLWEGSQEERPLSAWSLLERPPGGGVGE